jgi:hypothetical protein
MRHDRVIRFDQLSNKFWKDLQKSKDPNHAFLLRLNPLLDREYRVDNEYISIEFRTEIDVIISYTALYEALQANFVTEEQIRSYIGLPNNYIPPILE